MKKLKLFLFAFVMLLTGTMFLTACDKEQEPPVEPIVAVDSVVNPIIDTSREYTTDNQLINVSISTSIGDTPGLIVWETPSLFMLEGENEYTWIFTPEDSERYKSATGTIAISAYRDYGLEILIENWEYNEDGISSQPHLIDRDGYLKSFPTEWGYYQNMQKLDEKPVNVGNYVVEATVTVPGKIDPEIVYKSFSITKANVTDFNLTIQDWEYLQTENAPQVNSKYSDMVSFVYSETENGTYSNIIPVSAGEYYVKAIIEDDNYAGESAPVKFNITKAEYGALISVSISGWGYGEQANAPVVVSNNTDILDLSTGVKGITYEYAVKGTQNYSTTVPTSAGEYTLKVTVGESNNGNYKETVYTCDFEITEPVVLTYIELVEALNNQDQVINIAETVEITGDLSISYPVEINVASEKTLKVLTGVTLAVVDGVSIVGSFENNGTIVFTADNFDKINNMPAFVDKFVLANDITNDEMQDVEITENVVIDLNGKTLTNVNFVIKNSVTIENGTINNGLVIGNDVSSLDIVFNNLTIVTIDSAVKLNGDCNYTFTNCNISAEYGLYITSGTVIINACSITGSEYAVCVETENVVSLEVVNVEFESTNNEGIYINILAGDDINIEGVEEEHIGRE